MRHAKHILISNLALAIWCAQAGAQTNPTTTTDSNRQPAMSETVREFDRIQANSDRLRRSSASRNVPRSIAPVLAAIPQFRKATEDLREAVGEQKSPKGALQSIEKLIKPFSEYFKDLKLKPSEFDASELKTYSHKDLVWETLTTAERVDNNLQITNRLLRESSQSGVVTIKTLQFYGEIDTDLKRLKWLSDKVTARR
jgi:hypothetical protein